MHRLSKGEKNAFFLGKVALAISGGKRHTKTGETVSHETV
ncbi:hypothetical protein HMPREF0262_00570 [Clostridium sp. ATCC 29733]|nr:hypothetical protein HMPREF0262_00570 [Clostridium sp. ATCC 29733]